MKHIDEIYKEWSGVHHTVNSCHPVHDSAEACDFAEYYYKARIYNTDSSEKFCHECKYNRAQSYNDIFYCRDCKQRDRFIPIK